MTRKTIRVELRTVSVEDYYDCFVAYDLIYKSAGRRWCGGTIASVDPYYNCGIEDDRIVPRPGSSVISVAISFEAGLPVSDSVAEEIDKIFKKLKIHE